MPEFFILLLKVNASLIIFCLAYYLILRRLTFYTLNRFFLLAGIVFSSVYPFVDPAVIFGSHKELVKPITNALPEVYLMATESDFDYWMVGKIVFWTGVTFMAIRMLIRFYSLYKVHQQSKPGKVSEYQVRLLEGNINTFSFWRSIYLNPDLHQPKELDAVLEHEQVHVKEWHTIDILLAELSTIFYWFNPGVWYMRKAVKENVEFITDHKILRKGIDRKAYQYSMINSVSTGQPAVLMNHFNMTGIKRRIIMMNSKKSSSIQLVRYVFLLPVLLVLTSAFTLFKSELKIDKGIQYTLRTAKEMIPVAAKFMDESPVKASEKIEKVPLKVKKVNKLVPVQDEKLPLEGTPIVRKVSIQRMNFVYADSLIQHFPLEDLAKMMPDGTSTKTDNRVVKITMIKRSNNTIEANVQNKDSVQLISLLRPVSGSISSSGATVKELKITTRTFINNEEASKEQIKSIDPSTISRIDINKGYGNIMAEGVYIFTKEAKN